MRWQNPVRTQTGAGVIAIWTRHGRPEAMASIFQWNDDICHEFGSLSRSNKLVGRNKSDVIWSPKASGVDFRDVPDAPSPAADRTARLRQMKRIADHLPELIDNMLRLASGDPPDRAANEYLLNRIMGKPIERQEHSGPNGAPILTESYEYNAAIAALAIGSIEDSDPSSEDASARNGAEVG